jgi:hypothetical protein
MVSKLSQIKDANILSKLEKRDAVKSHVDEILDIMERGKSIANILTVLISRHSRWLEDTDSCLDVFTEEELKDVQEANEVFKLRMNELYTSMGVLLPK